MRSDQASAQACALGTDEQDAVRTVRKVML